MNKFILISTLIFFSLFGIIKADSNIAFIDMDKVMSTSNPGSSIVKQLTELNNKNLDYLKSIKKSLEEKEIKIISQKNIISDVEFQSKVDKLRLEINNYNKDKNKINSDFNNIKTKNTNNFLKMINPILSKYSNDKSISIILQKKNLVIGKIDLDITSEIIKIINNEIKEFRIK